MQTLEWIIGLLLGALLLSGLARRLCAPYPAFLALGGVALAFLPNGPAWTLEPDLALALFVAPVLLDAAYDTSLRDLRDNWLPVTTLVFMAVGLTTAVVAVVARWLVPDMPWSAAVALGAIVAPPDAAAATAILRQVRLPHRIVKILEGESLLNDASALLVYRIAVGAAAVEHFSLKDFAPTVALALVGSLIFGVVAARIWVRLVGLVDDAPSSIIMQFAGTFLIWIVAERLHLSGVLTIVAYAVTIARVSPTYTPARLRVPSYAVWETAVFVLNVVAFVMIGMQLGPIWDRLPAGSRLSSCLFAGMVLVTVIVTRLAWVMFYNTTLRVVVARRGDRSRRRQDPPRWQGGLVVSWAGMRGLVTLAAAFALPEAGYAGGFAFPYRDLILLTAFAVVLGSLLFQGLTLRPLIAALRLDDNDPVGAEVAQGRATAYRAALAAIDGEEGKVADLLRYEYRIMLRHADDPDKDMPGELPADPLRRRAIGAARRAALALRASGEIGDDAFHRLEEEFDWAELSAHAASAG